MGLQRYPGWALVFNGGLRRVYLGRVKRASWSTLAVLVLASGPAYADARVCIGASERAQQLRTDGKLVEAKVNFLACADETCPTAVKVDCAKALEELAPAVPSVIIAVREANGTDADPSTLSVSIDGVLEPDTLGGRSVELDPGPHHVRVDTPRGPVTLDFVAREGELRRALTLRVPAPRSVAALGPAPDADVAASDAEGHTAAPWVIFGVGAAAVTFGTVAIAVGASTDGHGDLVAAGAIAAGVGAVGIAAGLIWHFLEPDAPRHRDIFWRVQPSGFALATF